VESMREASEITEPKQKEDIEKFYKENENGTI
jgi:hypothetical protein